MHYSRNINTENLIKVIDLVESGYLPKTGSKRCFVKYHSKILRGEGFFNIEIEWNIVTQDSFTLNLFWDNQSADNDFEVAKKRLIFKSFVSEKTVLAWSHDVLTIKNRGSNDSIYHVLFNDDSDLNVNYYE